MIAEARIMPQAKSSSQLLNCICGLQFFPVAQPILRTQLQFFKLVFALLRTHTINLPSQRDPTSTSTDQAATLYFNDGVGIGGRPSPLKFGLSEVSFIVGSTS